jgi:hypothetical protein
MIDTGCIGQRPELAAPQTSLPSCALDLSRSRTHDAVLDILKAYKLTGNFQLNLEAVLKDMGVFDKVTYQVEPVSRQACLPDCRHVVFTLNEHVPGDAFAEIIRSIKARIGFDAPWWVMVFRGRQSMNGEHGAGHGSNVPHLSLKT